MSRGLHWPDWIVPVVNGDEFDPPTCLFYGLLLLVLAPAVPFIAAGLLLRGLVLAVIPRSVRETRRLSGRWAAAAPAGEEK